MDPLSMNTFCEGHPGYNAEDWTLPVKEMREPEFWDPFADEE